MRSLFLISPGKTALILLPIVLAFVTAGAALAQGTGFTYQGRLSDGGTAANGTYDLQFKLYDALSSGNLQGAPNTVTRTGVNVTSGIFTVQLDFGASGFSGADRFLEIGVKHPADSSYTTLLPRQQLTAGAYAIRSLNAANADTATNAAQLGGVGASQYVQTNDTRLSDSRFPTSGSTDYIQNRTSPQASNFNISGSGVIGGNLTVSGTVSGNGSGLTNVNATVADGSITASKIATNVILNPQKVALLQWYDANRSLPTIAVGFDPRGLAFDGTFIYVANSNSDNVMRIRAGTGIVEGSPIPVGNQPLALAFDGIFIYVANLGSNNVTRIRTSTGVVEGSPIPVGSGPFALAFDGTFMYVANINSNSVTRIRADTGAVEGSPIPVGNGPFALAFDGTFIYVANRNNNIVMRIRAGTGAVEGSPIPVGTNPQALAFDGTFMYVANASSNNVMRIRTSSGVVEGSPIPVGTNPQALAFDGTFMYVANNFSNNVMRIRAGTGVVEGSPISVGVTPSALAFDGTLMYVANANSNSVTRF